MLLLLLVAGGSGYWWTEHRDTAATDTTTDEGAAVETGGLLIVAQPWGKIDSILNLADGSTVELPPGSPFTPRQIELPAGEYEITLSHSQAGSRTCRALVTSDGPPARCEAQLFEIDPRAYFQEMGW